ncbi:MAG: glycosyltransferase [Pirellulales bacterium]|nr:glycosyltransferase [Pirellulales bacterium]
MNYPGDILHIIRRLDGYGGARMVRYVAASQAAAGRRVAVAALGAQRSVAEELHSAGVAIHRLSGRGPLDPVTLWRLYRLQQALRPKVVHAWDLASATLAALACRVSRSRLVASLDADQLKRPPVRMLMPPLASRMQAFVASDESTRDSLISLGADKQRIRLIPPGTPAIEPPQLTRAQFLAHFQLPPDALLIAVLGKLHRRKCFDDALWCFELVRVLHENAVLLIIGDGPDYERLERFAELVTEPASARLLGYRPDAAAILPHIDVYWQTSPALATPQALLEAAAAGAPIVASDLPAHRAIVVPGRTGLLAPLGDRAETARATDELINDRSRARSLGAEAAASVAERWSLSQALKAYGRLYGEG